MDEYYKVEKLIDRRKNKGKIEFLVKWRGYEEPTWQARTSLYKDIPGIVKNYEKKYGPYN